ncbi:hypothetical protein L207DRAFT_16483 [Hyaloscypha variabilis F]|uniref:Uncharacterized protein n=1 Tax=Hyaloscypha variabilis (strain UAMH 11265 / GT02V1 / F) TaxID=1149755 RepID=A0A2J6SDB7_HYAVF|nr:hypothetical protein L207DRAFT_16483 [Hyaloscypha variabilis F]
MRKIGLVAIKEPQCRAGLALQSRTADLQAPMKLSLRCAEGRETTPTRFKLRRLVRFSRLARALFAPLSGCPTRENSRGTAQGSVRAAYENSDSRTRAANSKSHCRVGHFDWTLLLQNVSRSSVSESSDSYSTVDVSTFSCTMLSSEVLGRKEVAGRPKGPVNGVGDGDDQKPHICLWCGCRPDGRLGGPMTTPFARWNVSSSWPRTGRGRREVEGRSRGRPLWQC